VSLITNDVLGPRVDVHTYASSPWSDQTLAARYGSLYGVFDATRDEMGIAAVSDPTDQTAAHFIASQKRHVMHRIDSTWSDSDGAAVAIDETDGLRIYGGYGENRRLSLVDDGGDEMGRVEIAYSLVSGDETAVVDRAMLRLVAPWYTGTSGVLAQIPEYSDGEPTGEYSLANTEVPSGSALQLLAVGQGVAYRYPSLLLDGVESSALLRTGDLITLQSDNIYARAGETLKLYGGDALILEDIPISATGLPSGAVYSDSGTLKIVS